MSILHKAATKVTTIALAAFCFGSACKPPPKPETAPAPVAPTPTQASNPNIPIALTFLPPPEPPGYVSLKLAPVGQFSPEIARTIDLSASFMAAFLKFYGDTNHLTLPKLAIVESRFATNRGNSDEFFTHTALWIRSSQTLAINQDAYALEVKDFFNALMIIAHENYHANEAGQRPTSYAELLKSEIGAYNYELKVAHQLHKYCAAQPNIPPELKEVWATSLNSILCNAAQSVTLFELRLKLLEASESCQLTHETQNALPPDAKTALISLEKVFRMASLSPPEKPDQQAQVAEMCEGMSQIGLLPPAIGILDRRVCEEILKTMEKLNQLSSELHQRQAEHRVALGRLPR